MVELENLTPPMLRYYSLFNPNYREGDSLYQRKGSNFIGRKDTYSGVKLTPTRYKLIPGAYSDKYNSDTYKILNKGVDDRSWMKRNGGKVYALGSLGASAAGGAAVAMSGGLAIPVIASGAAIGSTVAYLRNRNRRNKELQMKMIDAHEALSKTKKHSFQGNNPDYKNGGFFGRDSYKGKKLTHGVLQGLEPLYSDFKYRDNMALLRGKKLDNKGLRGNGTSLAYAGGLLASKVVPVASLPLFTTSLINSNRQDRDVQIEAIKLANKLNKRK